MIEMASVDDGLYRRSFADDTFSTALHMKLALGRRTEIGFASRVGSENLYDRFVDELAADGL